MIPPAASFYWVENRRPRIRPPIEEKRLRCCRSFPPSFTTRSEKTFGWQCPVLQMPKLKLSAARRAEGSIWLLDTEKKNLVIAYNSGPNAQKVIGFAQSLSNGLVSATFATEQGMVENEVYKNVEHDHELNRLLNQTTYAMIVVPFYFLNQRRGVISCVQLIDAYIAAGQAIPVGAIPPGFARKDLVALKDGASIMRDLIDFQMLREALGWNAA